MKIQEIELTNFRNYDHVKVIPHDNINIFLGKNATGKTNFLESISVILTGKSFKTNRDQQLINFNSDETSINGELIIDGLSIDVDIYLKRNAKKIVKINDNEIKKLRELTEDTGLVVFTPEDMELVKEGPGIRRKFLDDLISSINIIYSYNLSRFKKILNDRNAILKYPRQHLDNEVMLKVYNMQLSSLGNYIIKERMKFIDILNEHGRREHLKISEGTEELSLKYISNIKLLEANESIEKAYLRELENSIQKDKYYRTTTIGPHRDDIQFSINGRDAKIYASQGQQRTVVLSIKLTEAKLYRLYKSVNPVIILDDVFSELDSVRKKMLIESFQDYQVFISMTDDISIDETNSKAIFKIDDKNIERIY